MDGGKSLTSIIIFFIISPLFYFLKQLCIFCAVDSKKSCKQFKTIIQITHTACIKDINLTLLSTEITSALIDQGVLLFRTPTATWKFLSIVWPSCFAATSWESASSRSSSPATPVPPPCVGYLQRSCRWCGAINPVLPSLQTSLLAGCGAWRHPWDSSGVM